jgi:hypothetical protein
MSFKIEQVDSARESFGNDTYRIYKDGHLIAHYWHDYRGDEHGIEFINGENELWPVGRMTDFIEGGGPKPLTLSERAVTYINRKRPLSELPPKENNEKKDEERSEKKNCECRNHGRFGGFVGGLIFGGLLMLAYFLGISPSEFHDASKLTLLLILLGCGIFGAIIGKKAMEKVAAWLSWFG